MPTASQTYRSLVMRKAQQLAKEHGGFARIPRELQRKLGFDVIAKRKTHTISVRIPQGDLSSKISQLEREVPTAKAFGKSKPGPDPFGRYYPVASEENPTMEDFWIGQGWYKEVKTGLKLTSARWGNDFLLARKATVFLAEKVLAKHPYEMSTRDFGENMLGGMLRTFYRGSAYRALADAGYGILPWEMKQTPLGIFKSGETRVRATKWLVQKTGKSPREIRYDDFRKNGLRGLLSELNDSAHTALLEAGYFYTKKEAIGHLERAEFPTDKFYPWEAKVPKRFFREKRTRLAATCWLAKKLGRQPREMRAGDFKSNNLAGMLKYYYGDSPYEALLEAGLVTSRDEDYMRSNQHARQK